MAIGYIKYLILALCYVFLASSFASQNKAASTKNVNPELILELRCENRIIKSGNKSPLDIEVFLINKGQKAVNLVQPGDGSGAGLRTPRIKWSTRLIESKMPIDKDTYDYFQHPKVFPDEYNGFTGCGNLNSLKRSEIFTLLPNREIKLVSIGGPSILSNVVGKFGIKFYYENLPQFEFKRGYQEPDAIEIIRSKTPKIQLESNELVIEVIE